MTEWREATGYEMRRHQRERLGELFEQYGQEELVSALHRASDRRRYVVFNDLLEELGLLEGKPATKPATKPVNKAESSDTEPVGKAESSDAEPVGKVEPWDYIDLSKPAAFDKPVDKAESSNAEPVNKAESSDAEPVNKAEISDTEPVNKAEISDTGHVNKAEISDTEPVGKVEPWDYIDLSKSAAFDKPRGRQREPPCRGAPSAYLKGDDCNGEAKGNAADGGGHGKTRIDFGGRMGGQIARCA